jgi:hypothetical protein
MGKFSLATLPFHAEPDTQTNPKAKRKRLIWAVYEQAEQCIQLLRTGPQCQQLRIVRGTLMTVAATVIMPLAAIKKEPNGF